MKLFSITALLGLVALLWTSDVQAQQRNRGGNSLNININSNQRRGFFDRFDGRRNDNVLLIQNGRRNDTVLRIQDNGRRRNDVLLIQNNGHHDQAINKVTTLQLLTDRHHRGQLNQLNTYHYANNTPANIRFLRQERVYYNYPPVVAAPIIERYYVPPTVQPYVAPYIAPAPQQYVEPAPQPAPMPQAEPDPCNCNQGAAYLTQPQVGYYTQPQAITSTRVYYTAPRRTLAFTAGGYCH